MVHCQLWMGGLEPYMTESFIMASFSKMGETPQSVKVIRNRFTGEPSGYCFVHFPTDEMALNAMHKLSGKVIPNSDPPVRFKLNHASTTGKPPADREFSLWVGDLTPEVDDYTLFRTMATHYPSIRVAKVILDNNGVSKGYGFIRFASEEEQKACLLHMNGYKGFGKPIKISNAVPKLKTTAQSLPGTPTTTTTTAGSTTSLNQPAAATTTTYSTQDYSQYYAAQAAAAADPNTYWQGYQQAWQGYYDTSATTDPNAVAIQADYSQYAAAYQMPQYGEEMHPAQDDLELIEHSIPIDIDKLNYESIERDYNLWDAVEGSGWLSVEGGIEAH